MDVKYFYFFLLNYFHTLLFVLGTGTRYQCHSTLASPKSFLFTTRHLYGGGSSTGEADTIARGSCDINVDPFGITKENFCSIYVVYKNILSNAISYPTHIRSPTPNAIKLKKKYHNIIIIFTCKLMNKKNRLHILSRKASTSSRTTPLIKRRHTHSYKFKLLYFNMNYKKIYQTAMLG